MILVDIYVPSVDTTYNFKLNETVDIQTIIEEITEMIEQKENTKLNGAVKDLCLYNRESGRLLPTANSLNACGIRTGSSLMLI